MFTSVLWNRFVENFYKIPRERHVWNPFLVELLLWFSYLCSTVRITFLIFKYFWIDLNLQVTRSNRSQAYLSFLAHRNQSYDLESKSVNCALRNIGLQGVKRHYLTIWHWTLRSSVHFVVFRPLLFPLIFLKKSNI